MIIIAGTVDVDPEKREKALSAAEEPMRAVRAQPGCLDYVWSADPLTPGRIYVYERWETTEQLAAHLAGPNYVATRDAIASGGMRGADVAKFEIGRTGAVYDNTGTPRADFF